MILGRCRTAVRLLGKEPARSSSFSDDGSRIVSKRQQLHVLSSWRKTVRLLGEDQPDRLSQITEAASSPSGSSFIFSHLAGRRLSFGRRTAADRLSHMTESASSLNGNRFIFSHLAGRRFVSGGGQPQPNRLSQIGIGRGGGAQLRVVGQSGRAGTASRLTLVGPRSQLT